MFLINDLYLSLCFLERESGGVIFVEFWQVERNLLCVVNEWGIYRDQGVWWRMLGWVVEMTGWSWPSEDDRMVFFFCRPGDHFLWPTGWSFLWFCLEDLSRSLAWKHSLRVSFERHFMSVDSELDAWICLWAWALCMSLMFRFFCSRGVIYTMWK